MGSYFNQITDIINAAPSEAVFVASDFADSAEINTVRQCLSRLELAGDIQRIMPGVYYQPVYSQLLGEFEAPSPRHVAAALARKFNWTIAPAGATALNQLGLSTQVPAQWTYISDGPYNSFSFGNTVIEFKHRNNKEISGMSDMSALVIQALKALGKSNIDDAVISKLQRLLSDEQKAALLTEAKQTTAWVYQLIKRICKEEA